VFDVKKNNEPISRHTALLALVCAALKIC